jgi:predicted DNA-binding protein
MPTTTTSIRLGDELKQRVAAAAQRSGKTPNAFIVDAITTTVEQAELQADFDRVSDARWEEVSRTGKTISLAAADEYLSARARGEKPLKPRARSSVALAKAVKPADSASAVRSGRKVRP